MAQQLPPTLNWRVASGANLPSHWTSGEGVAVGPHGDIYQTAETADYTSSHYFPFISKFSAEGPSSRPPLWSTGMVDSGESGLAFAVAVDTRGFAYAAGELLDSSFHSQLLLVKLDANGGLVWRRQFGNSGEDAGVGVALDAAHGFAYVLDSFCEFNETSPPYPQHACWLRYDLDGNLLTQRPISFAGVRFEEGVAVTADTATVTVLTFTTPTGPRVTRYNLDGTVAWTNIPTLFQPSESPAQDIAEDTNGNVVVAASGAASAAQYRRNFTLFRYNPQGQLTLTVSDSTSAFDISAGATDAGGNLYGVGPGFAGSADGVVVDKFDPSGRRLWSIPPIPYDQFASVRRMAVDASGNVYLSGSAPGCGGSCAVLAKYSQAPTVGLRIIVSTPTIPPLDSPAGNFSIARTSIEVDAIDAHGNLIPQSFPIDMSVNYIPRSGGHEHDGPRPVGQLLVESSAQPLSYVHAMTNANGQLFATYLSTIVGGQETVEAAISASPATSTSAVITVAIPWLVELQSSIAPKLYNLTGSFGQPGVTSMHSGNHYSTLTTQNEIVTVAAEYLDITGYYLGINDMSLVYGGVFDITNNWNTPHLSHRIGHSTDISIPVEDSANPGTFVSISCPVDKDLRKIVTRVVGNAHNLICESGGRKHVEIPQSN